MSKYSNWMVDLETMSTQTDAAIISIGAVFMDFENECLGSSFYFSVDSVFGNNTIFNQLP